MTVIIPFTGNCVMLAQLLVALQPQLNPNDDIYILDQSKFKGGLQVSRLLATSRCFVFVEPTEDATDMKEALATMRRNKQDGALVIQPHCVVSTTFIANLKKAIKLKQDPDVKVISPEIVATSDGEMDVNFEWYQRPTQGVEYRPFSGALVGLSCFYIEESAFDKDFNSSNVNKNTIAYFDNERVVILPASFDLLVPPVKSRENTTQK